MLPADSYVAAARRVLVTTALVGVLTAIAPRLPGLLRSPLLVVLLLAWAAAVATASVQAVRSLRRGWREREKRPMLVVAATGVLVGLTFALQLELLRTVHGPAFTWQWRWNLNHAQAIARYGGLEHALDYAGAGIDYHVGPAWLAGMWQRTLGGDAAHVLFGVVPPLSLLATVIAVLALFREFDVPHRVAGAATAVAFAVPLPDATPWGAYFAMPGALLSPASWPFLPSRMMLGSLLALAVGFASLALLFDRRGVRTAALGSVGLASLISIKPQYFVAFAAIAALAAAARLAVGANGGQVRVLAAATAALALAAALMRFVPADLPMLAAPLWAPQRGVFWHEPFRLTTGLALASVGSALYVRRRLPLAPVALVLAAWGLLLAISGAFVLLEFPCRGDVINGWTALELPASKACYGATSAASGRDGLAQTLEVARFTLLAAGAALLLMLARVPRQTAVAAAAAAAVVILPLPLAAVGFARPATAYGVAKDGDLLDVLAHVPVRTSLLVSSDLADPAEDYARPLQGMLLTAYFGHQFYVANLAYLHHREADAVVRLHELQSFFGNPWNGWHSRWLADRGVTHVLVSQRCPPPWRDDPTTPLVVVTRAGGWTAYAVPGALPPAGGTRPPPRLVPAAWGRSACLSGRDEPLHAHRR